MQAPQNYAKSPIWNVVLQKRKVATVAVKNIC